MLLPLLLSSLEEKALDFVAQRLDSMVRAVVVDGTNASENVARAKVTTPNRSRSTASTRILEYQNLEVGSGRIVTCLSPQKRNDLFVDCCLRGSIGLLQCFLPNSVNTHNASKPLYTGLFTLVDNYYFTSLYNG